MGAKAGRGRGAGGRRGVPRGRRSHAGAGRAQTSERATKENEHLKCDFFAPTFSSIEQLQVKHEAVEAREEELLQRGLQRQHAAAWMEAGARVGVRKAWILGRGEAAAVWYCAFDWHPGGHPHDS